jgi:general secretion pathway protein A
MSYEQFFGLNDAPFSLAPDPRYLFESASHSQALQQLAYAIERREPLLVVTGEIGTGKTLLCRTVLQRANRRAFVSVIHNPLLERDEFLKQLLQDFGIVSTDRAIAAAIGTRHDLVHALEDFLSSLVALDAHAVVIIDEAQHVQPDVLEQIRLLSNIDAPGGTRLQIILVGQLDLETLLARPELRQCQQRVSRRIRLEPLAEQELPAYVDHRLSVGRAGGSPLAGAGDLARALSEWEGTRPGGGVSFNRDALRAVWQWSGGLPRVVNLLCDRSLEEAYARQVRTIDADIVATAAAALQLGAAAVSAPAVAASLAASPARRNASRSFAAVVVIAVVAGGAAAAWFLAHRPATPPANSAPAPSSARPAPPAAAPPPVPAPPSVFTRATEPASPAAPPATSAPTAAAAALQPAFEIVVASFRTEPRAAAVAAQVSAAGLPVRQREAAGWQQVIAGPFASRDAADAARLQLERAGLGGTRIVAAQQ